MELHPMEGVHNWKQFLVHMTIVVLGIMIAIGLEQSVEWVHHRQQRRDLQADLQDEARKNERVIARDLEVQELEPWFEGAMAGVANTPLQQGKIRLTMPLSPCLPGSVGSAEVRYFAPSEAVWTTAKESGLTDLLPVGQGRMYARLAHNYDLLAAVRDRVASGCDAIVAMQRRLARRASAGAGGAGAGDAGEMWTLTPEQAEELGKTAAQTQVAIQGLLFRLRWSDVYEQGIVRGENKADEKMMTVNQAQFEDAPEP
ncbi:MAG TPA: hypothetical protein VHY48_06260 [Acidobacteriaceae bacterium]|jgi:hypothetical protein|nr:hypothetical protein [Acidobacteriaceae bacterium]